MAQTNHTMPPAQLPPHRMLPTCRTHQHHHTKQHQPQPLLRNQQKQARPNPSKQSLQTKHPNHSSIWNCPRLPNQPRHSTTTTAPHKWLHIHTARMDNTCHTNQAPQPTQTQKHRPNTPQMATPAPHYSQPHFSPPLPSYNPTTPQLNPPPPGHNPTAPQPHP